MRLKANSVIEGELMDLVEEFSEGRIQFAFVKVKDPNTALPKNALISWCGEGVPERTKGYFNSHRTAVSKLLHGYHVEVTARSDRDLTPEGIVQKVADASGAKYGGGSSMPSAGGPPPPIASKPVFTPTRVGGGGSGFNPLGRSRVAAPSGPVDNDGWGDDAPQVTRTQLEKVQSAYKPTKVDIGQLQSQREPSRYQAPEPKAAAPDVVRGGYQPIGKVDINELRRQAKESGNTQDDRPTIVKGAYEPVGKVDIAAIRAKAQRPGGDEPPPRVSPAATGGDEQEERPRSLADRSAAFQSGGSSGGRILTEMPKPKVANKFGGSSAFTGTKAPAPGGFDPISREKAAPVGVASRTFADEGGKTPAQIWAEKKARQGGGVISPAATGAAPTSPISAQKSGGWESGYTGKKWGAVQTTHTGKSAASNLSEQRTGQEQEEEAAPPSGGVGSIRDRFSGAGAPPPVDMSSRPNVGGGVAIPGLASRPSANDVPAEQHVNIPPPPAQPRSPSPEPEEEDYARPSSPIRVAMPVSRSAQPEMSPVEEPKQAVPAASLAKVATQQREEPEDDTPSRSVGQAAAAATFGAAAGAGAVAAASAIGGSGSGAASGGIRALIQYDYEKAEDNELELVEGQYVTNIEMVDEDWWMGTNSKGESGLFPSNYVEVVEGGEEEAAPAPPPAPVAAQAAPPSPPAPAAAAPMGDAGKTATAQYEYDAAEDNELSFPDGAKILNVVSLRPI